MSPTPSNSFLPGFSAPQCHGHWPGRRWKLLSQLRQRKRNCFNVALINTDIPWYLQCWTFWCVVVDGSTSGLHLWNLIVSCMPYPKECSLLQLSSGVLPLLYRLCCPCLSLPFRMTGLSTTAINAIKRRTCRPLTILTTKNFQQKERVEQGRGLIKPCQRKFSCTAS